MGRGVKIVACSDIHGRTLVPLVNEVLHYKPDIFVIAGDLQGMDGKFYYEREFVPMVRRLSSDGITTVLVPGNHDFYIHDNLAQLAQRGLYVLVDSEATVCGLRFYGTPWCPFINGRWVYEVQEEELAKHFKKIPAGLDVLISHTPPLGKGMSENFDVPLQFNPQHVRHLGSTYLREQIIDKMPHLAICGHIHSGEHKLHQFNSTTAIANVSLLDEGYNRAYGMARITILLGRKLKFTQGRKLYGESD